MSVEVLSAAPNRGIDPRPDTLDFLAGLLDQPPVSVPEQALDPKALFMAKNPHLARRLPTLYWHVLDRLTHRRRINELIVGWRDVPCRAFPAHVLRYLGVSTQVSGVKPPPEQSRPVFVANHPSGGLDGLVLLDCLLKHYRVLRVPVNDLLCHLPHLVPVCVPIDGFRTRRDVKSRLDEAFACDAPILLFPAGRTARMQAGRLREAPWHKLPVVMTQRHARPIVPVHIDCRNSRRFYLIHRLRTVFGIRSNLEMLLLVDELMCPDCSKIHVRFGPAITPQAMRTLAGNAREKAAWLRRQTLELARAPHT